MVALPTPPSRRVSNLPGIKINVELEFKLIVRLSFAREICEYYLKLGSDCEILVNPAEVIFGHGNPNIFPI